MAAATSARTSRAPFSLPFHAGAQERSPSRRVAPPLEHRMLMTATLCLLAFGAVMVYCASSPASALASGNGAGTFIRYVLFACVGVAAMYVLERRGVELFTARTTRLLLFASYALLVLVLMPGFSHSVLGAKRWFQLGPIQFQPSELMKLALVLYVSRHLAEHPRQLRSAKEALRPLALVIGPACLLIWREPDLGTTLVIVFTMLALMIAAGVPARWVGMIIAAGLLVGLIMVLAEPYQRARLLAFMHPASAANIQGSGYQGYQGEVTFGSGGLFGVGLGKSVQDILTLPEAQTDFILAVVGEQLGIAGVACLIFLYGLIAYAGLRTARRAGTRQQKLLATGLTSLILCQALLNIFVVLGIAPLTGVPLPFISYAPTNLCVMLASVGLLLNISRPAARRLQAVEPDSDPQVEANRRRSRQRADLDREHRRRQREDRRAAPRHRTAG